MPRCALSRATGSLEQTAHQFDPLYFAAVTCHHTYHHHHHYQVTLEPYERDHAMVVGVYRPPPKAK